MARLVRLANGINMPALGYGTWLADPTTLGEPLQAAIKMGYRHIDCAERYKNEEAIGKAFNKVFQNDLVKRSDLFITGKLWPQDFTRIREMCEKSLKDLQVDYLDQYLAHFPVEIKADCQTFFPENDIDLIGYDADRFQERWRELEKLYEAGLVRSIGVCNITKHKLSEILKRSPEVRPHVIQNEYHPHLPQWKLLEYCKEQDVTMVAFSSLGNRERPEFNKWKGDTIVMEEPAVIEIAQKHNVSNAQVLLAWGMQRGTIVLTRSIHEHEMQDSLNSTKLTLDQEDMDKINGIETRCRYMRSVWMGRQGESLEDTWDGELLG